MQNAIQRGGSSSSGRVDVGRGGGGGGGGRGGVNLSQAFRVVAGPCLNTALQNWKITNTVLFAKPGGSLLRFGIGLLTGGAVASQQCLVSFGQLAKAIVSGARTITTGGVTFTLFEGAILSLPNAALNSTYVGGALEAGVTVGSFFNKDCFRFSVPTTFVGVPVH